MLSQRKVDQILANQSTTARKLYEIMTVDNKWNVHQVTIEFKNANNGNTPDRKVISGCLNDLTDSGLLKRTGADLYSKSPVRKAPTSKDQIAKMVDPIPVTARAQVAPTPAPVPKPSVPVPVAKVHKPTLQHPPVNNEVSSVSKQAQAAPVNKDPLDLVAVVAAEALEAGNKLIAMSKVLEKVTQELKVEREKSKAYSEKIKRLDALLEEFKS